MVGRAAVRSREVTRRMRALDAAARVVGRDIPLGTLRSIERQGERALGPKWLLGQHWRT